MDNVEILDYLFWVSMILSAPLLVISLMAVGKHASDLQYQVARGLNGIRWIQSWINLRTHGNRVLFAFVFGITSVLGVAEAEYLTRAWVGRIGFLIVLIAYTASSILDWMAEAKQLQILLKYEEVNQLPKMRVDLHALNNSLSELYGLVEFLPKDNATTLEINKVEDRISLLVKSLQHDIHSMDPSYRSSRKEADHAEPTE